MLEQLLVKDLALSQENDLRFAPGLTAITGETGAGKSLTVDALSLVLGARAESSQVRKGCAQARVEAVFSLPKDERLSFLTEQNYLSEGEETLILTRVVGADGKSRSYVNNRPVTLGVLREVGAELVSIHGQHASIRLIDSAEQRKLLDAFGRLEELHERTAAAFAAYSKQRAALTSLSEEQQQGAAAFKSARYDLEELQKLAPAEGSYEALSAEFDVLMNRRRSEEAVALCLGALEDPEHNLLDILSARISDLIAVKSYDEQSLGPVIELLSAGAQSLDEARDRLSSLTLHSDPQRAEELGNTLGQYHDLARRYALKPQDLYEKIPQLQSSIEHFLSLRGEITKLTEEVKTLRADYEALAGELSAKRQDAALKMSAEVTAQVRTLAMPDARFEVRVTFDAEGRPRQDGRDEIQFWFSANRGQDLLELGQAASGGEISRLALVIEALCSGTHATPTLVFDEVDTGISGRTASAVGALLRSLGEKLQVITVTHLPQVAAAAHQQFCVSKEDTDEGVRSRAVVLDERSRIEELARMMGGEVVTEATLTSAKELLHEHGGAA